jgi:hypothetical protein
MALKTNSQKVALGTLSVLTCILFVSVVYLGTQAYLSWTRQPLEPVLDYPTAWELPATWTVSPGASEATLKLSPTLSFATETPDSPFLPCTDLSTMNLLAIGTHARSDEYCNGRAEVIRVARVDFGAQRVTVLEFSRDLWVKLPDVRDNLTHGISWKRRSKPQNYRLK